MSPRNLIRSIALIATLFTTALAAAPKPEEQLQASINDVIEILHLGPEVSVDEKRNRVLAKLEQTFSFDIIIRRTLGRNWSELNEDQQKRITILITDLLIKAYTHELSGGGKPVVKVTGTDKLDSKKIEVQSVVTVRNAPVSVDYRLANITDRGWQVYDVLVEGTSIVSNYRRQFDEHFQTKSAEALLDVLQSKVDDYDK